jgi:hypothetical protein
MLSAIRFCYLDVPVESMHVLSPSFAIWMEVQAVRHSQRKGMQGAEEMPRRLGGACGPPWKVENVKFSL